MNDMPGGGVTREYAGGKMLAAKDDGGLPVLVDPLGVGHVEARRGDHIAEERQGLLARSRQHADLDEGGVDHGDG